MYDQSSVQWDTLVPKLRRVSTTGGGEYAAPCPFCGGRDRFRVWPTQARYWCRQCNDKGDAIDLIRKRDKIDFGEALRRLGLDAQEKPTRYDRPPVSTPYAPAPRLPPSAEWQAAAREFVSRSVTELWKDPENSRALQYLRRRGFEDETIQGAHIGYNPKDQRISRKEWGLTMEETLSALWLPRGLVMPWYDGDTLWKVSIRRPTGTPLHLTVAGSSNAAYNADNLNLTPVVLVESVLDALAVAQEARDICTPIATGTTGARTPLWMQRIVLAPLVLISYDADEAGGEARRFWKSALPMSGQIWLPWAEDHAEMLRQGHDLLEWVSQGIGSAAHLLK